MRKIYFPFLMLLSTTAMAQSSVTLYGFMDAGITYTNHVVSSSGGSSNLQFVSSSSQGDHWGIRGSEDFGGGNKAIFDLESGYLLGTGAYVSNNTEFSRLAYVGLSGEWGTLTAGKQYDLIGDTMWQYAIGPTNGVGVLSWSLPSYADGGYTLDNRVWGIDVNNSVKYISPIIKGFSFGAMYGFGNVAGSIGTDSSSNFILNYANGPFLASLAYMGVHNATASGNSSEYAVGASYTIGHGTFFCLITDVQLSSGTKPRATTFEGGMTYLFTPTFSVGGGLQFQERNNNLGSANQATLSADYFLSKRTDVYIVGALLHDHAYSAQVQAAFGNPSGTDVQTAVRIGFRHHF